MPTPAEIQRTIEQYLTYRSARRGVTEISFYGGNFLGLSTDAIRELLCLAAANVSCGRADGIRFSTRPDTIDPDRLALIASYPVTTIELGAQSMHDATLRLTRRGHGAADTLSAIALLRRGGRYAVGLQMMIGLPGSDAAADLDTARRLADLKPDFTRIYPTLVLRGSPLAAWTAQGRYAPLDLAAAIDICSQACRIFAEADVPVIRMGLQPSEDINPQAALLAGPFHPAFGELVHARLWLQALYLHLKACPPENQRVRIRVHPRRLSRLKGQKNGNLSTLRAGFGLTAIDVVTDPALDLDLALVNDRLCGLYVDTHTALLEGLCHWLK